MGMNEHDIMDVGVSLFGLGSHHLLTPVTHYAAGLEGTIRYRRSIHVHSWF